MSETEEMMVEHSGGVAAELRGVFAEVHACKRTSNACACICISEHAWRESEQS